MKIKKDEILNSNNMENDLLNRKNTDSSYPYYNVIQSEDIAHHILHIELAVAGFTVNDLKVVIDEDYKLYIEGVNNNKNAFNYSRANAVYLHKGIARRSFVKVFSLANDMRIFKTVLKQGILTITIIQNKTQHNRKEIDIIEEY